MVKKLIITFFCFRGRVRPRLWLSNVVIVIMEHCTLKMEFLVSLICRNSNHALPLSSIILRVKIFERAFFLFFQVYLCFDDVMNTPAYVRNFKLYFCFENERIVMTIDRCVDVVFVVTMRTK